MLHVQCDNCRTSAYVECAPGCERVAGAHLAGCPGANLDGAVRCATPAGDPEGSPEGSCCAVHSSHEEHAAHVAAHGDASCRPVTITVLPGSVQFQAVLGSN